ncbi:IclR family transcriptional regulator [Antarcticimicrobium luteum]|nr:helix-turn-helix domain-containing protein [Antarcticimicrobium luteum]
MSTEKPAKPEQRVAALERGLQVLNCFLGDRSQLSLTEISERTGHYKSTALRLCSTLQDHGFLHRNADGLYSLGAVVGELGNRFYFGNLIDREAVLANMRRLHSAFDETVAFYIPLGLQQMCLYRIESPKLVRASVNEGDRIPIGCNASGLVIEASRGRQGAVYDSVRENGVAFSSGAVSEGASAVAAPLLAEDGDLIGVYTIIGPDQRFDAGQVERMIGLLKEIVSSDPA